MISIFTIFITLNSVQYYNNIMSFLFYFIGLHSVIVELTSLFLKFIHFKLCNFDRYQYHHIVKASSHGVKTTVYKRF